MRSHFVQRAAIGIGLASVLSCTSSPNRTTEKTEPLLADGRKPASSPTDKTPTFAEEFANATEVKSTGIRRASVNDKNTKLIVLQKWARFAPDQLHAELQSWQKDHGDQALSAGTIKVRSQDKALPSIVITSYQDAAEINAKNESFRIDSPNRIGSITLNTPDAVGPTLLNARLASLRETLPAVAATLLREQKYEGRNLRGRPFGRLEVVEQFGRLLPYQTNTDVFGLKDLNFEKAQIWGRAWRDALEFNFENDPRVDAKATAAFKELQESQKLLASRFHDQSLLDLISRSEITQTAIAHVMDVLLSNPKALAAAKDAAARSNEQRLHIIITEALRLQPVYPFQVRISKNETTLASGLRIPANHAIVILNIIANRDPVAFPEPETFQLRETDRLPLGTAIHSQSGFGPLTAEETLRAVSSLVVLPGVRRAPGSAGEIDRRAVIQPGTPFKSDEFRHIFPERFSIEWDIAQPSTEPQIASAKYSYETYLNDFDRDEYRLCMSGQLPKDYGKADLIPAIIRGLKINKLNLISRDNKDHLFCRMNVRFRQCILDAGKQTKFHHLNANSKHQQAYEKCQAQFPLTSTEQAYYRAVMLHEPLDSSKITKDQIQSKSGPDFEFENYLKFYNRYTARESMMNPAGMLKFGTRDILFYVRLNLDFRGCMGFPVVKHELAAKVGIEYGRDRNGQYEYCKNGVWNPDILKAQGRISNEERYYYEKIFLERDVRIEDYN